MNAQNRIEIAVPACRVAPGFVVTARSYLIDRMVPECEIVALPERQAEGGRLSFGLTAALAAGSTSRGLLGRLRAGAAPQRIAPGRHGIDLRRRSPQNWAHFLNIHVPLCFEMCRRLGLDPAVLTLVLPADTPGYIGRAAALFGFEVLLTDGAVEGPGIVFELSSWGLVRPARADWVRASGLPERIAALPAEGGALPRRVYLSRRQGRALANEDEVLAVLARYGFERLWPEDLSVRDQFRLFEEAEAIVAIHGAGLAPLLYRSPGARLRQVVELMPAGHMTNVYQLMAQQVGVGWIAVRGRIKPAYVAPAYDLGKGFDAFSLDTFEIDPVSVERAFALAPHPVEEGAT